MRVESRGESCSDVESDIQTSKVHWSDVDRATMSATESDRAHFELLKRRVQVRQGNKSAHAFFPVVSAMLKDVLVGNKLLDRFALLLWRKWGNPRTLIDQRMVQTLNRVPPSSPKETLELMQATGSG